MTVDALRTALETLRADYEELRDAATFVEAAASVRQHIGLALNWDAMETGLRTLAQRFMRQRSAVQDAVYRGMFVSAASSYEQCVRSLVEAGASIIALSAARFDDLHEPFKLQHMNLTGRALATVFTPRRHLKYDYFALAANLGTCVPGARSFSVNTQVFASDVTTPDAEGLTRALQRIGVDGHWEAIGRSAAIQRALGSPGVKETTKLATKFVDEFVAKRNLIAHGGRAATTVVRRDIEEVLEILPALCLVIAEHIEASLTSAR